MSRLEIIVVYSTLIGVFALRKTDLKFISKILIKFKLICRLMVIWLMPANSFIEKKIEKPKSWERSDKSKNKVHLETNNMTLKTIG